MCFFFLVFFLFQKRLFLCEYGAVSAFFFCEVDLHRLSLSLYIYIYIFFLHLSLCFKIE